MENFIGENFGYGRLTEYGLFANIEPDENDSGKLLLGAIGVILNFSQNPSDCHADYTERIKKAGNVLSKTVSHVNMSGLLKAQKLTARDKKNTTRSIVQEMECSQFTTTAKA